MSHPFPLFEQIWTPTREVLVTPEITSALEVGAAVAIGVSGGKDSAATALATIDYLEDAGHRGPRVLIHSDLGRVEWRQSLPACQRLAVRLGLELMVVRRETGDLVDRWRLRWENNVRRYAELSCVKLILPWSTASMRFCTSELKTSIICRALVQRFPGQTILSATGIRRQESPNRAKAPVAKPQPKLASVSRRTQGLDWHPILDWTTQQVFGYLEEKEVPLHEAYTQYGSSRVSCCFCILSSQRDLGAAARCAENQAVYRDLVGLEAASTFSFQPTRWLGDVAPHWLTGELRQAVIVAKACARRREAAEAKIPQHLLYTEGWPRTVPTLAEASLLSDVRREVASAVGIEVGYTEPLEVIRRFEELLSSGVGTAA
jgi:3'-phosphoadenosine 5'-phosphosulfate sulfotransferase (PAPS reductase)/FAD synthetase